MIHSLCTKSSRESKNLSLVWHSVAFSFCNHLRCTYSNSCNWRVATKLYISPWLPQCRLFATSIPDPGQLITGTTINIFVTDTSTILGLLPSMCVQYITITSTGQQVGWSVHLSVLSLEFLQKPAHNSEKLALFTISGMCTSPPASLPLGGQSGLGVYRGQSGCTENYSTNTFSTGFLPQLYKVGWLSKRVDSFLL